MTTNHQTERIPLYCRDHTVQLRFVIMESWLDLAGSLSLSRTRIPNDSWGEVTWPQCPGKICQTPRVFSIGGTAQDSRTLHNGKNWFGTRGRATTRVLLTKSFFFHSLFQSFPFDALNCGIKRKRFVQWPSWSPLPYDPSPMRPMYCRWIALLITQKRGKSYAISSSKSRVSEWEGESKQMKRASNGGINRE